MTFAPEICTSFSLKQYLCTCTAVTTLAGIYSDLLEEKVSPWRTLHFVHAQMAIFSLILFGGASVLGTLLLLVWTLFAFLSAAKCKG
jgi:hypothetical protein